VTDKRSPAQEAAAAAGVAKLGASGTATAPMKKRRGWFVMMEDMSTRPEGLLQVTQSSKSMYSAQT
jgi:hypothetical protein